MKLADVRKLENGARFHSVDLHIHSYGGSHDVKDKSMTPEAIVESAVKQQLSVIAITDHNSDINIEKAITYAQKNYPKTLLVLAGVEVTTSHGHLLAYFSPDKGGDLAKYLVKLELIGDKGAAETRTAKSMSDAIALAHDLDAICIAAHIDRDKTGFDKVSAGFPNWKKDIICSPGLYGLECDAIDSLKWYSDFDSSDSIAADRKRLLEARRKANPTRFHLAHVQGSDSHTMKQFEHQNPLKPWTRVKLTELSFNALRVALIDASARVRAIATLPKSFPRVIGMTMTGGFLHDEHIHFSNNLNCFIGGRGTGKSTAIRAIAFAFGLIDDFGEFENCPDTVSVFCEDENGVVYEYARSKGSDVDVKAKEDGSFFDVPIDAFQLEYYGQGVLAKVAEDPMKNPKLLQDFLDRHINLRDLVEAEESLVDRLKENAGRLKPLESEFAQLTTKKATLAETEKKLKIAEEGNLREIVGIQSKLASEKSVRDSVDGLIVEYLAGASLTDYHRSFDDILDTAGECTADPQSIKAIAEIKKMIDSNNASITQLEEKLGQLLKDCATQLSKLSKELKSSHQRISADVNTKVAALKAKGVVTDIPGLEKLLRQKSATATEIASIEKKRDEIKQCKKQRVELRASLKDIREKMTERRKAQLQAINVSLRATMKDYAIFIRYDDAGITDQFEKYLQEVMEGTYMQDETIKTICEAITPSELADLVLARDYAKVEALTGISSEWSHTLVETLCYWHILFELHVLAKHPKPIITVKTLSTPSKEIPVIQLSDGQRHTILLSIAMLAESNIPLIIDQPEDDLDNAFIFSTVVSNLREIKEKRQVIVVTHNANIAVLGDSELLLPMYRENDCGQVKDRGSIDASATLQCVQNILEGGAMAFLRRKEIYGH